MPKCWMITNRSVQRQGGQPSSLGADRSSLSYWTSDDDQVDQLPTWTRVTEAEFKKELVLAASKFPVVPEGQNEKQRHVAFFVHGYNNTWQDAARRYRQIVQRLFQPSDLGLCVLFTWP